MVERLQGQGLQAEPDDGEGLQAVATAAEVADDHRDRGIKSTL